MARRVQNSGDIGNAIQSAALSQLYGVGPFDTTLPAEPGPPTGVKAFAPGEESYPAFLFKFGARIFQRARERATARSKMQQQALADSYKRAQIDRLQALTEKTDEPTYSVEVDGQKFSGLKGGEAARLVAARDRQGATIDKDPITGKPLPVPMTVGNWLTMRGQDMTSGRAAASRDLSRELAGRREKQQKAGLELRRSTAELAGIREPSEAELKARAGAVAQDSLAKLGKKNPSAGTIKRMTEKLYPYVSRAVRDSLASRRDSLTRSIGASSLQLEDMSDETRLLIESINQAVNTPGP